MWKHSSFTISFLAITIFCLFIIINFSIQYIFWSYSLTPPNSFQVFPIFLPSKLHQVSLLSVYLKKKKDSLNSSKKKKPKMQTNKKPIRQKKYPKQKAQENHGVEEEGGRKTVRVRGGGWFQGNSTDVSLAHRWAHGDWDSMCAQDLHRVKPNKIPALGRSGHEETLFALLITAIAAEMGWYCTMVLICISLVVSIEHFLICLAICRSSFQKCLIMPFTYSRTRYQSLY